MYCWFPLRLPSDQKGLDQLKRDMAMMKKQFGNHYAFLPATNLKPLVFRLKPLSTKELFCGEDGSHVWFDLQNTYEDFE